MLNLISKTYVANWTPFSFYVSVCIDRASKICHLPILVIFSETKETMGSTFPRKASVGQISSNGDRMSRMEGLKQTLPFVRLVAPSKADTRHNGQDHTNT